MSSLIDPPIDTNPADPFDYEDRPLRSDSEGPRDSLLGSDEEQEITRRMLELQDAALNRRRDAARDAVFPNSLFAIQKTLWGDRPAGPFLSPEDAPRVAALSADLVRETRGRERFSVFPEEEFSAAAGILVR